MIDLANSETRYSLEMYLYTKTMLQMKPFATRSNKPKTILYGTERGRRRRGRRTTLKRDMVAVRCLLARCGGRERWKKLVTEPSRCVPTPTTLMGYAARRRFIHSLQNAITTRQRPALYMTVAFVLVSGACKRERFCRTGSGRFRPRRSVFLCHNARVASGRAVVCGHTSCSATRPLLQHAA